MKYIKKGEEPESFKAWKALVKTTPNWGYSIYTDDGQILETDIPENKAAAATTIDKLCLNIPKLIAMRKEVIKNLFADIIDELTDEERLKLVQGFEQLDANGQYEEFCGAIAYILKQC